MSVQLPLSEILSIRKKRHYNYASPESKERLRQSRLGRRAWNKGLTKETSNKVKEYTEKSKKSLLTAYKEGRTKPWNAGIKVDRATHPNMGHYQKHSEDSRKKISEANLRNPQRYWLGKRLTEVAKKKLSEKQKAKGTIPPSRKGTKSSEETRLKQSRSLKGKKGGFLGGKHTEETKKRIGLAFRGDKHPNWKGGITPLVMKIRLCPRTKIWRDSIFSRDNFTCHLCGKRGGRIEADHYPIPFSEIFKKNLIKSLDQAIECKEFWDINNGRTLCRPCHDKNKKWKNREKPLA